MKTRITIVLLTLALIVGAMFGAMSRGNRAIAGFGSAGVPLNVSNATGVLAPANGGVGAMTGAPMWPRNYGDGSSGAGPASGAVNIRYPQYNTNGWTCTGAITNTGNGLYVRSQGPVNLNTGCTITITAANVSTNSGDWGGAGGSGGGGAAASVATRATALNNVGAVAVQNYIISASAALSAVAGNNGGAIPADSLAGLLLFGPPLFFRGGTGGSAGGSSGGAAGSGNSDIIIAAPSITIASGVVLDVQGGPGVAPAANSTGAGGGGGGGSIYLASQTFTDNGSVLRYGGGSGGAITAPSIQAAGDGCNTAGCGTGAAFTITALSAGGLSAGSITIANAGSGYNVAPTCLVNAGASGLVGSPACHFTVSGGAIASVVIDTAGSGGTLTTFTTTFIGGYGANGFYKQLLIQ